MYPGVELRLYRYVTVLAEELNFTNAASRLHVSQPTLSTQIRDLEQELRVRLFDRTKGGQQVTLTAAGVAFTNEARVTLFHAQRAVEEARSADGRHQGPWTIAYSPLVDLRILSKIRKHLAHTHPLADIRVASAHTSEQADGLLRGNLQAGLVILPVRGEGLTCEGLFREPLVLILPERHPLAAKPEIEITDLHDESLAVIRSDIEPRFDEDLSRIFALARIRPRIFHRATTQGELLELVSEGSVAALAMPSAQYPPRDRVVFRNFVDEFLTAEMGLVYLGETRSPILASLRKFLVETFHPFAEHGLRDGRARQMTLF
jgi:DNA-binding transcriptional LysR family regulator